MGHPAHFHLFKNLIKEFSKEQYLIVITNKDILSDLLISEGYSFIELAQKNSNQGFFSKFLKLLISTFKLLRITLNYKPEILIGCLSQVAWVGFILRKKTFFFAEDDYSYTKLQCKITYPFITNVLTAEEVDVGPYHKKQVKYPGFHKLAYLHPTVFNPSKKCLDSYGITTPYFLIRLVSLSAHHDVQIKGINEQMLEDIISELSKHGKVYISSEKKMPEKFASHMLKINVSDMHSIMNFANGIISDSQSMTVESCMLGVPNIRINSFKNKISVLNNLEHTYNLTSSFNADEFNLIDLNRITEIKKEIIDIRKKKLLKDKIYPIPFYLKIISSK